MGRESIRYAVINSADDSGEFRNVDITTTDDNVSANLWTPYGLISCPPSGGLAIVLQVGGEDSNKVALADYPQIRTKGCAQGEVGLENPTAGTKILLKNDGTIDITTL